MGSQRQCEPRRSSPASLVCTHHNPPGQVYSTSTSLTSGWASWQTFADKGSNTYSSQTNYILNFGSSASSASNVMYMGDRWVSSNLQSSTYVWLPLTISGGAGTTVTMPNRASWVPNVGGTGAGWSAAPAQTTYDATAPQASYGGSARTVSCAKCPGGHAAAGYVGGSSSSSGTVAVGGIRSDAAAAADGTTLTTVQVRYVNGDTGPRRAAVAVDGRAAVTVAFQGTGGAVGTSVLHVPLARGSGNRVVVGGVGDGGWGPDLVELVVPVV